MIKSIRAINIFIVLMSLAFADGFLTWYGLKVGYYIGEFNPIIAHFIDMDLKTNLTEVFLARGFIFFYIMLFVIAMDHFKKVNLDKFKILIAAAAAPYAFICSLHLWYLINFTFGRIL